MSETPAVKYKKSSRLNSKNQQKVQLTIQKSWKQSTIDVVIVYQDKLQQAPKVFKNLKVYFDDANNLVASHLIQTLKNQGIVREQSSISFFNHDKQIYVYGFIVPKEPRLLITNIKNQLIFNNSLTIKIRNKKKFILEALIEQQRQKYDNQQVIEPNSRGNKQKKIGEVVQKVALWRKFYTGFYDQMGNYIQKPLQTAANQVGIAKKTLDDYLLQIRNGKKYGFNFNEKVNAKIGELRAFVRQQKKKEVGK